MVHQNLLEGFIFLDKQLWEGFAIFAFAGNEYGVVNSLYEYDNFPC